MWCRHCTQSAAVCVQVVIDKLIVFTTMAYNLSSRSILAFMQFYVVLSMRDVWCLLPARRVSQEIVVVVVRGLTTGDVSSRTKTSAATLYKYQLRQCHLLLSTTKRVHLSRLFPSWRAISSPLARWIHLNSLVHAHINVSSDDRPSNGRCQMGCYTYDTAKSGLGRWVLRSVSVFCSLYQRQQEAQLPQR